MFFLKGGSVGDKRLFGKSFPAAPLSAKLRSAERDAHFDVPFPSNKPLQRGSGLECHGSAAIAFVWSQFFFLVFFFATDAAARSLAVVSSAGFSLQRVGPRLSESVLRSGAAEEEPAASRALGLGCRRPRESFSARRNLCSSTFINIFSLPPVCLFMFTSRHVPALLHLVAALRFIIAVMHH